MDARCIAVSGTDPDRLVRILHDAEEDDERIRAALGDPTCQAYEALEGNELVGAAVVRWADRPIRRTSEILYLAVAAERRGSGVGRQLTTALKRELPRHGRALLVGTANSALDTIAFYQKCGFRMHAVKRDYFAYIQPPMRENGILMRDMIVFGYDLDAQ